MDATGRQGNAPAGSVAHGEGPGGNPSLPAPRWFASLRFRLVLMVLLAMGPALTVVVHSDLLGSTYLAIGTALFALAVSWLFGDRFIMDPVDGLVRATRRLSHGDIRARRNPRYLTTGEFGRLERAFDEMALSLEVRTHELRDAEAR